ncbi:MAG: RluA family pseudouridine synthase [Planctomycetaceae bacterium]
MTPPVFELIVEPELRGVRIDSFLAKHFRNYSQWRLSRMVRCGCASVNGAPADETRRVFPGEAVRLSLVEPPDKLLNAESRELPVYYVDPWMLVVDKPAGMIAHPTGEYQSGTLANILQSYFDQKTPLRGLVRPGIVHRLDRHTSGLMVVAAHHLSHRHLASAFEAGRVAKTYVALVEGVMPRDTGVIDLPIGRAREGRLVLMSARGDAVDAKPSKTSYRVLRRFAEHTMVECRPATGRNHQIRVHLSQIGHPLIGDEFYMAHGAIRPLNPDWIPVAPEDFDANFVDEIETGFPIRRHALHAMKLELAHPISGLWMTFQSILPPDFQATIDVLSDGASVS